MNKSQLINEFFKLTKADTSIEGIYNQFQSLFGEDGQELIKELKLPANREKLLDIIKQAYLSRFSSQEIQELISFYQTPVGKKHVETAPQIMVEVAKESESLALEVCKSLGYL